MAIELKKIKIQYPSPKAFITQYLKNIIYSGLFIPVPDPLPMYTRVELNLIVPELKKPYIIQAKVVMSVDSVMAKATNQKVGMAVQFLEGQEILLKELDSRLRSHDTYGPLLSKNIVASPPDTLPDHAAKEEKPEAETPPPPAKPAKKPAGKPSKKAPAKPVKKPAPVPEEIAASAATPEEEKVVETHPSGAEQAPEATAAPPPASPQAPSLPQAPSPPGPADQPNEEIPGELAPGEGTEWDEECLEEPAESAPSSPPRRGVESPPLTEIAAGDSHEPAADKQVTKTDQAKGQAVIDWDEEALEEDWQEKPESPPVETSAPGVEIEMVPDQTSPAEEEQVMAEQHPAPPAEPRPSPEKELPEQEEKKVDKAEAPAPEEKPKAETPIEPPGVSEDRIKKEPEPGDDRLSSIKAMIGDRDTVLNEEEEEPPEDEATTDAERKRKEFTPKEKERLEPVSKFILNLVKSMLRTGYYDAEHPEYKHVKEGIFDEFTNALKEQEEITLLNQETRERSDVMIVGILERQVSLRDIIAPNQAEMFIPKFKEYFHRKSLVSFSLKKGLDLEQFESFIDIMSNPAGDKGEGGEVGALLTKQLVDRNVFEVSTVFVDDMIVLEEKLPWRVDMSIQRLAKDLKVLPMFKGKSKMDIQDMKLRIVQDIIRPLREPHLLKDIVVNSHVIAKNVPGVKAEDLEQIIVQCFPMKHLLPTSKFIFEEVEHLKKELEKTPDQPALLSRHEGIKRILKLISTRVIEERVPQADKFFEQLYLYNIMAFEELPRVVQDHINTKKLSDEFKADVSFYLAQLDRAAAEEDLLLMLRFFRRIMPEFMELGIYDLPQIMTRAITDKFQARPDLSKSSLESIKQPIQFIWADALELLRANFEKEKKTSRGIMEDIVVLLGSAGVELLIKVLMEGQDKFVRKSASDTLIKMGDQALQQVRTLLRNPSNPWYLHRNALGVIGRIGDKSDVTVVGQLLRHSDFRVREQALSTLSTLEGAAAEPKLVLALSDRDPNVRKRAIACIGLFPLTSDRVVKGLTNLLRIELDKDTKDKQGFRGAQVQAIKTLASIGNVQVDKNTMVEDVLVGLIYTSQGWSKKLFSKIKQVAGEEGEDYSVQIAACQALAKIGTEKVIPDLKTASEKAPAEVAAKAKEAINTIQLRSLAKEQAAAEPKKEQAKPKGPHEDSDVVELSDD